MVQEAETHFDSLESAHQFVKVLGDVLAETRAAIADETRLAELARNGARRLEGLQLVDYKLDRLATHLDASRRLLNDLRMLRRVLAGETAPADGERVSA